MFSFIGGNKAGSTSSDEGTSKYENGKVLPEDVLRDIVYNGKHDRNRSMDLFNRYYHAHVEYTHYMVSLSTRDELYKFYRLMQVC